MEKKYFVYNVTQNMRNNPLMLASIDYDIYHVSNVANICQTNIEHSLEMGTYVRVGVQTLDTVCYFGYSGFYNSYKHK